MFLIQTGDLFGKRLLKGVHPRHVAMQNDTELVAAYAEAVAVMPVHVVDSLGNGNETLVAHIVTVLVVHTFEVIDIEEDYLHRVAEVRKASRVTLPVKQARESIGLLDKQTVKHIEKDSAHGECGPNHQDRGINDVHNDCGSNKSEDKPRNVTDAHLKPGEIMHRLPHDIDCNSAVHGDVQWIQRPPGKGSIAVDDEDES